MKYFNITSLAAAFFICFSLQLNAQEFCGTVEQVAPSAAGKFAIKISLSGTAAFEMGSSNLVLSFNNAGLDNPVLISSPAQSPPFNTVAVTEPFDPGSGAFVLNINNDYAFDGTPGFGYGIATTDTEFAIVEFDIIDATESSGINWLYTGGATQTVINLSNADQIFADDAACLVPLLVLLPLELVSFEVKKDGQDNAKIFWETSTEINISHFEVERSFDRGITWEKAGMVNAKGNSFEKQRYSLEDKNLKRYIASSQLIYYRLKSIEVNDDYEYSEVKNIEVKFDHVAIQLYPNPTTDGVYVSVNMPDRNDDITAIVKDLHGRIMSNINLGNDRLINEYLDLKDLSAGTYFISVEGNNKVYSTERIILTK